MRKYCSFIVIQNKQIPSNALKTTLQRTVDNLDALFGGVYLASRGKAISYSQMGTFAFMDILFHVN